MSRVRLKHFAFAAVTLIALAVPFGLATERGVALALTPRVTASPRLAAAPDQFLRDGRVWIRYREVGKGPAVVLLHGYTDRLEKWGMAADSLGSQFRVIALDLRGFGESTKFSDPAEYGPKMGEDVVRLLNHLGIRRAHLVGFSMGAMVAAGIAERHPERVRSLTTLGAPLFTDSAAMAGLMEPTVAALSRGEGIRGFLAMIYPHRDPEEVARIAAGIDGRNHVGSLIAAGNAMAALELTPGQLRAIRAPAVSVVGTADFFLPQARSFIAHVPRGRLVVLEGVDHAIVGRPQWIAAFRTVAREAERGSWSAPAESRLDEAW